MLFAIALCLLYGVLLIGLQRFSGVPYNALPDSSSNLLRGGFIPVAIMGALLAAALALSGRLLDAFSYAPRASAWVLWVVPALFVIGALLRLGRTAWGSATAGFVVVALVTSAVVGVSEELLVRGYLVDVLQAQGTGAVGVALVSSIVFGVIHGLNALNGQDVRTTVMQVVFSTVIGLGLFAALAVSGSLWLPIVLHALFDFSILVQGKTVDKGTASKVEGWLILLMYAASVLSVFFI